MLFKINAITIAAILAAFPPSATGSTTTYDCKVDADYKIDDDPQNPTEPTASEQAWAADKVMSAYDAIHSGGDFDMDTCDEYDFTMTQEMGGTTKTAAHTNKKNVQVHNPGQLGSAGNLRGGSDVGLWVAYVARIWADVTIVCSFCQNWDDDDAAMASAGDAEGGSRMITKQEQDMLQNHFQASADHDRWVEAWCDELQQGPHSVFEFAYECAITLYDCTTSTRDNGAANLFAVDGEADEEDASQDVVSVRLGERDNIAENKKMRSTGKEELHLKIKLL